MFHIKKQYLPCFRPNPEALKTFYKAVQMGIIPRDCPPPRLPTWKELWESKLEEDRQREIFKRKQGKLCIKTGRRRRATQQEVELEEEGLLFGLPDVLPDTIEVIVDEGRELCKEAVEPGTPASFYSKLYLKLKSEKAKQLAKVVPN